MIAGRLQRGRGSGPNNTVYQLLSSLVSHACGGLIIKIIRKSLRTALRERPLPGFHKVVHRRDKSKKQYKDSENKADPETIVYRISSLNPTALITRFKKKKKSTIHRFKQDTNLIKFKMS